VSEYEKVFSHFISIVLAYVQNKDRTQETKTQLSNLPDYYLFDIIYLILEQAIKQILFLTNK
jgi:hypothetical protein